MSVVLDAPVELWPTSSFEDKQAVIRAVYKQVLGNPHVMESERLTTAESKLCDGSITVREFVRAVAKSDFYRSRYFESCAPYRFVELNFKHLLGRAPLAQEELSEHICRCIQEGYEAEIDSYLDSDEYQNAYGENIVPYYRGYKTQPGQNMVGFTHMFALLRGASSSDLKGSLAGKTPVLNKFVIQQTPLPIVPPSGGAVGDGWAFQESAINSRTRAGLGGSTEGKVYRITVTGYRSSAATGINRVSKFRSSNQAYLVPFERLSQEYQRIHKQGGIISSITAVN